MELIHIKVLTIFFISGANCANIAQKNTELTIIHINDFHAHFDEMSPTAAECKDKEKCIGGYARLVHMVKYLQEKYKNDHPLYLNAGDNFQGTPWYTMFTWNVTKHFLNLLPADVITLGNHEFDHGIDGLLPFIGGIKSKLLVGNVDDDSKHFLQRYSKDRVHGRTIINKGGIRIGVIGVILKTVPELSNTGNITFLDEVQMVKRHARHLTQEDVNIIIVLSHCGIEIDKRIAKDAGPLIDVIVGGHSHTYLYSGKDPTNPPDTPYDKYPIVVTQDDGHVVLIVQAGAYGKYVGVLRVLFDSEGEVASWTGNNIYLDHEVGKDEEIVKELEPWKMAVKKTGRQFIGEARVLIDHSNCKKGECTAGNLVTDAMVEYFQNMSEHKMVSLALYNAGGVRASLEPGSIIYNHLLTMLPFGSTVDLIKIPGTTLKEAFEHAVINQNVKVFRNLLQVSGFKVTYNLKKPVNERVEQVLVLERQSGSSVYKELNEEKMYEVIITSFLFRGGDGFRMFKRDSLNHKTGAVELNTVTAYIRNAKTVEPKLEGRIIMKY